ncbi:MAG: HNH endonuclease [Planctomycetes bacterium]|nr:HNH endonuclease [Planctomycetota bacterium]
MHRMIINPPNEMVIDHIDHNGLNNRRSNLRICTSLQNARNRRPSKQKKIKYKGVSSTKAGKKFQANITINQKQTIIGYYKTELQAAKAYDKMAKKYHKEYACLNFPEK